MESGNEQLCELIAEGNSLLDNNCQGIVEGLAVPISISPKEYNAWIDKIRVWLGEHCTDPVQEKFEEIVRPKNSSAVRVKRILTYLKSLLNNEQSLSK